jgi:hypothetical protein
MDDDEISKLLRLKRFEQPTPDYYESFLDKFKERQRSQLLRESAWQIAWDRLCAFFGEQLPARIGYGLASTAVLVAAGITSLNILASHPEAVVAANTQEAPAAHNANTLLTLNSQQPVPDLPSLAHTASFSEPRYVLNARPMTVSYVDEPTPSF